MTVMSMQPPQFRKANRVGTSWFIANKERDLVSVQVRFSNFVIQQQLRGQGGALTFRKGFGKNSWEFICTGLPRSAIEECWTSTKMRLRP